MWRRTTTLVLATAVAGAGLLDAKAGFLGVEVTDAAHGVQVTRVIPGSPAEAFGLKRGYIIAGLGSEAVSSTTDFVSRVQSLKPGEWASLRVIAGGTLATSMITTQDRVAAGMGRPFEPMARGVLSIAIEDHEREVLGVRVMDVQRAGAGDRGGLRMSDVVVAVNGIRTEDSESFLAAVARRAGQRTPITLIRRERPTTLVVVPEAMDARAVFASIPEMPEMVASDGTHWCERGTLQTVVCVTAALGAILMIGSTLDDDTDPKRERDKVKAEQERQERQRRPVQEYERALETNEIRRRSLPN